MDQVYRYELTKAVKRLQHVMDNIDKSLLEDAQFDGDQESVSNQMRARSKAISIAHASLSREFDLTLQTWRSAIEYAVSRENEEERRALVCEYQSHWSTGGGEAAEGAARDLITKLDVIIRTLPQGDINAWSTPALLRAARTDTPVTSIPRRESLCMRDTSVVMQENPRRDTISSRRESQTVNLQAEPTLAFNTPNNPLDQVIRLPKFDLPVFTGDIASFPEFWDVFDSAVHSNRSITPVVKFHYLRSALRDDALSMVSGYEITEANYEMAVNTLREAYFRPDLIRMQLSDRLQHLKPATTRAINQRVTFARIKSLWLQLKKFGEHDDSIFVMRLIREKFPSRTLKCVGQAQANDTTSWKVPQLLDALDKAIKTFEVIEDSTPLKPQSHTLAVRSTSRSSSQESSSSNSYRRSTLKAASPSRSRRRDSYARSRCAFCKSPNHPTPTCHRVTSPRARRQIVDDQRLCFLCFSNTHMAKNCEAPPCPICNGGHHRTICREAAKHSYRTRRSRSSSRSSRSSSRGRESSRRYRSPRERVRSPRRDRSPSPTYNTHRRRSPYTRSVRFDTNQSNQSCVGTQSLETRYIGELVDTEDEDLYEPSLQCSVARSCKYLPEDPRLMVVTARSRNHNTSSDELLVLLLDSGAQHSFIREDTAKRLGLKLEDPQSLTTRSFGGYLSTENSSRVVITLRDQVNAEMRIALRTRKVTTSIRAGDHIFDDEIELLRSRDYGNRSADDGEVDIDILIGIDHYWKIVDPQRTQRLPSGFTIVFTRFGPVMSGLRQGRSPRESCTASLTSEARAGRQEQDPDIKQLWDLEFVGITDSTCPAQDDYVNAEVVRRYYDTVQVVDGLIHVQFPWKEHHPRLLDNKFLALRRLQHQYDSLHSKEELWKQYCATFDNQERSGIIEEVGEFDFDGPQVYYMPHQAVLKADSTTTAVRIVFDASSHQKGAPSLNDCLHQGPTLLPDLAGALLRARLPRFLIISDVEKAFHQIRLQKDQRDVTRFLWLKNTACPPTGDNLRIFRFTRVVFGINVSPFLLNMSIKYALERNSCNTLREEVLANTYVDNVLIGADSTEECIQKQKECKQTFQRMGMNLREFMSNNASAMEHIPEHDRMKVNSSTVKLLGLQWDPVGDIIHIQVNLASHRVTTKREALRAIASNFDPLGYLTPLFVKAKIFIQDLWKDEYEWDSPFGEQYSVRWQEIMSRIEGYRASVPRFIAYRDEQAEHEILLFADASKRMYSVVSYLLSRTPNSPTQSHLLMAKTRLAPVKETTIPRLELMACDIATSLAQFLLKELKIDVKAVRFFSDSHIALYWIHTNRPMKAFVDNRVKRIQNVLRDLASENIEAKFYYVSTESNPADCATRGLSAEEIADHIWWNGPLFVRQCPTKWPHSMMDFTIQPLSTPETDVEFKVSTLSVTRQHRSVLPFQRTNDYNKLLRYTALVLKFLRKRVYDKVSTQSQLRLDEILPSLEVSTTPQISTQDVKSAELLLFREHQRESEAELRLRPTQRSIAYKDSSGITRVSTRMRNADIIRTAKDPILLAPNHPFVTMIIARCHRALFHTGVEHIVSVLRRKYFIPRIRNAVRAVIRQCVPCRRHQAHPYRYPNPPDLPYERVTQSRPFQRIGLDYFGPILVCTTSSETRKVWTCLFTCMTTRALHLELVYDNSAVEFLFAFRRFIARRGTPDFIVSDNAPTFKLGREVLVNDLLKIEEETIVRQFIAQNSLRWKFITPFSPWKGGFYERLIGMVKRSLKKTIHRNTLHIRHFETLLIEIEATLNTRPLTTVSTEATGEISTLRPVDLISPYYQLSHFSPPSSRDSEFQYYVPSDSETKQSLKAQHEHLLITLDHFWSLWRKQYLQTLAERVSSCLRKNRGSRSWPTVGEVVLIVQENVPRTLWPLAIITKINTSRDGALRSVQVKTGKNSFSDRSVNQLVPLELHAFDAATDPTQQRTTTRTSSTPPPRIQPPRIAKRTHSR